MPSPGYVLGSAPDEMAGVSEYWLGGNDFGPDLSVAQFFLASNKSIEQMRYEEGTMQALNGDRDLRVLSAEQALSLATDNDSASGWVYASAPSESDAVDSYYDGQGFVSDLDDAEMFAKTEGFTLQSIRQDEGQFQVRFTDRDIRLTPVNSVITLT